MTLPIAKNRLAEGSVLVTTLVLAVILGATLAGYLYWVRTQNLLVAESQVWNAALGHAEAGIEDAMAQINIDFGTNYHVSATTNWGGSILTGVYGPRNNSLLGGSYSTIIIPISTNSGPTLISTGYAAVPFVGRQIARTVLVNTIATSAFANALTVKTNLNTKGNGLTVDSYDSTDPAHSTNGMYCAPTHKAGGDLCSTDGLISVQNANIYGKLHLGANASFDIGNGSVGDLSWNVKGAIQPGWYDNDYNADIKDVRPPFNNGLPVTPVNIGTNTYVLGSGDYYVNGDFVMSQNETLLVNGVTRLYVTGNFNMKSQNECFLSIAPGASLKLYVGSPSGSAGFAALTQVNTAGNAYTFQFYGLPTVTDVTWSGNASFVGTVYAPESVFSLGGGGSTDFDFQGACVAGSAVLNGHFNFHFDENLARNGIPGGFVIVSWQEL